MTLINWEDYKAGKRLEILPGMIDISIPSVIEFLPSVPMAGITPSAISVEPICCRSLDETVPDKVEEFEIPIPKLSISMPVLDIVGEREQELATMPPFQIELKQQDDLLPPFDVRLVLRLNKATVEELCRIKGIGKKKAEKIVAAAPFTVFDDLNEHVSPVITQRIMDWLNDHAAEITEKEVADYGPLPV